MNYKFRVEMVNGKFGYGQSSYLALVDAVGESKANIICDFLTTDNYHLYGREWSFYAKNGNKIMKIERL